MKIERIPIASISQDPTNVRLHEERSLSAIESSLKRFGQQKPVVVDEAGIVRAGNGTLEAARRLGWKEIDAVRTKLSGTEAEAYAVADNRTAELSEWNEEALAGILARLGEGDLAGLPEGEARSLATTLADPYQPVRVKIEELRVHPKNYRKHPSAQLDHIASSIQEHGYYRNIVVAKDNTILTGHGVVEAARLLGRPDVPVIRLSVGPDEPAAIRVMASDNEIARLAETDDRALSELLRWLADEDEVGLQGTGFDRHQLALLAMVSRNQSELSDENAAAEWAGMPNFEPAPDAVALTLQFDSEEERESFVASIGLTRGIHKKGMSWRAWWPERDNDDLSSLRVEQVNGS